MRERKLNTVITLRLTDEQLRNLRKVAEYEECSMTDIVREALSNRLAAV
jgi:uncharacterized protein (DUF1778 family)